MTVQTDTRRNDYVGNGSTTEFSYEFLVYDISHLVVKVNQVAISSSQYTVSGLGEPNGGAVIFNTAPADQSEIRLERDVPYTQLVDYQAYGPFSAEAHEKALDLLMMAIQQLRSEHLTFLTTVIEGLVAPGYAAGQYWRWDTGSQTLVNDTPVANTINNASNAEVVDDSNTIYLNYTPAQLLLAVQAHLHSLPSNPPIVVVASMPSTPVAGTVYFVTS